MNVGKMFPSRWMKAEHLDGPTLVTIMQVSMEEFEQTGDQKPAVYFEETEMALILNKTNATMIATLLQSDDTDDWIGKQIGLRKEIVPFKSQMVPSIRVYDPTPPKTGVFGKKPAPVTTSTEDVPTSWPSDATPAAEVTLEAGGEAAVLGQDFIPDPGMPISAKRRKNSY